VEERDGLFDGGLHLGRATGGEIHSAELIGRRARRSVRAKGREGKDEKKEEHSRR